MRCLLGVNLPYFYGSYGHDLAPSARHPDWPCDFHLMRAYRPLLEAKQLGFEAVRVWLCEGGEGLLVDGDGRIEGPHPRLLESIRLLEEGARVAGVRIYWGLLDANAAARDGDPITRSILEDAAQAARFAEKVAAPIARALDPGVLVGLEIVNEPEIVTESCRDAREDQSAPSIGWDVLGASIAQARAAVLAEKGDLLVTAGTGHVFLPDLWRSGAGLTAIDIHMYHPHGGLPSRSDLATYVGDPAIARDAIPLIAGECGVAKQEDDDPLALRNYLYNADVEGYAAAFLWKLEGDLVDTASAARGLTPVAKEVRRVLASRPESGLRW
ncbi:MAG: hypothetical protein M3Y87_16410 [Myxococcota bacterium]|nr:hypothetical protein [Myxococcota bacterium]